jgi:CBS domain-containing protein
VAEILHKHRIHAVVVNDQADQPVGILSDLDLMAGEWLSVDAESLEAMRKMTAGELMTSPIDAIEADEPVSVAAERMRRGEAHRLMVTQDSKPVGVISVSDVVTSLAEQEALGRETVADVMSRAMLVCRKETPLQDVARGMTDAGYRSVMVVDEDGSPEGFITGFDLMPYCGEVGCGDMTAGEVMQPPLTIRSDASLREAADKMIKHHYHRLVVVDPQRPEAVPLGIISTFDIVAEMAQPGSVWRE